MKPIHSLELAKVLESASHLVGGRFQEWQLQGDQLGLGIYKDRRVQWLWIDLQPQKLAVLELHPEWTWATSKKPQVKPLTLFIRSHLLGRNVVAIDHRPDLGRVFRVKLENPDGESELEFYLMPLGRNAIARHMDKKISLFKVHENAPLSQQTVPENLRTPQELALQWAESRQAVPSTPVVSQKSVEKREKRLQKLTDAIAKLEVTSQGEVNEGWAQTGEWLKTHGHMKVPKLLSEFVDAKLGLAQNIQICFAKAKAEKAKGDRQRERILELKEELRDLEARAALPIAEKSTKRPILESGYRYRELDGQLVIQAGRNAKENLELLRAAQPWDFWLHLKDYPSSHGLLRRNRDQKVSQKTFHEAGRWLIEQSFGNKAKLQKGNSFDVVICEKRFVKPIPGDKMGRVNYHNPTTLKITLD